MYRSQHKQGLQFKPNKKLEAAATGLLLAATMTGLTSTITIKPIPTAAAVTTADSSRNDLQTLVSSVGNYSSSAYTTISWQALQDASNYAQLVLSNSYATTSDFQTAYNLLNQAIGGLLPVDNPPIREQLQDYVTTLDSATQGSVSNDATNAYENSLSNANNVLNDSASTDSELQGAYSGLVANYKSLLNNQQLPTSNVSSKAAVANDTAAATSANDTPNASSTSANTTNANTSADTNSADMADMNITSANTTAAGGTNQVYSTTYTNIDGVGQVFFTANMGIPLYDAPDGNVIVDNIGNQRFLPNGTQWKIYREATLDDATTWYEVGTNQWVSTTYMMLTTNKVGTINATSIYGANLWSFQADGVHYTGRQLTNGSQWKVYGSMMIGGIQYFNLGNNQWINGDYIVLN